MATIFKHPELHDHIGSVGAVRPHTPPEEIPCVTPQYEAARLVHPRRLKLEIDHALWASLPIDGPVELRAAPAVDGSDRVLEASLARSGLPAPLQRRLRKEIGHILRQALPRHAALFAGYRRLRPQIVFRLGESHGENLRLDTAGGVRGHHAAMFINLDDQPLILGLGPQLEVVLQQHGPSLAPALWAAAPGEVVLKALNQAAFGSGREAWCEQQPRHLIYFDPGEVWLMDGRQVSHQTIHGRRLLCLDFEVDAASMRKKARHYLAMIDAFRGRMIRDAVSPAA